MAQGLINIGARYGSVDANGVLPHRQTVCDRAKKQAMVEKEAFSEVLKSAVHDNRGVAITTDMWNDDFDRRSYTVLTCHHRGLEAGKPCYVHSGIRLHIAQNSNQHPRTD